MYSMHFNRGRIGDICFSFKAFPNAKVSPPKRGDNDFMMRSNKLNSAVDMLFEQLKSKVDFHWEKLREQLSYLDPKGTGQVTRDDFKVGVHHLLPWATA